MEKLDGSIGFIGAGRVGCSLGSYLRQHGKLISGYYSRSISSAKEAADITDSSSYDSIEELACCSDIIFVTTDDGAIRDIMEELSAGGLSEKIICHCSGAISVTEMPIDCICLHPLLAVSSRYSGDELADCVFTIEGRKKDHDYRVIEHLASSCGNTVIGIDPAQKARYHAAAVFASNLVTGLYETAVTELCKCGFEREDAQTALSSLFLNNAKNVARKGMETSLTGPVERGDVSTVARHIDVLDGSGRELYILLSRRILDVAKRRNAGRDYGKMEVLLNEKDSDNASKAEGGQEADLNADSL